MRKAGEACNDAKANMDEFEDAISSIIGLNDLKVQLRKFAKGMLLDEKRRALELKVIARKLPHIAFLGNPGTGKTMVARVRGRLLHMIGILPKDKVTEVQWTDLVGLTVGRSANDGVWKEISGFGEDGGRVHGRRNSNRLRDSIDVEGTFVEAVFSVRLILLDSYSRAFPSLRSLIYEVVCHVASTLETRYTECEFWLADKMLFEEAERQVADSSEKEYMKTCIARTYEHLNETVSQPEDLDFVLHGQLPMGPSPSRPTLQVLSKNM